MKKIIVPLWLAITATCLLISGCSKSSGGGGTAKTPEGAPQGPVELKVKWTVGKQYLEQMTMDQDMEITAPGNPAPMHQQSLIQQEFSLSALKARPEGGVELELKFVSQKMSSKMDGREMMDFDSASSPSADGANPAAAMFRKIIGAHVTFLTDANGKIEKVEGYDDFLNQISGDSPQAQMMIKGMFNEDTLKQFGAGAQGLPDKPVKVGDTWPFHLDVAAGPMGTLKMSLKYKFAGWQEHDGHNCAFLTYTGDLTSDPGTNKSPMNISISNGTITGKGWFDPALGTTVDGTADQSMAFTMKMGGQKTDSQMTQKISVKLLSVNDISK